MLLYLETAAREQIDNKQVSARGNPAGYDLYFSKRPAGLRLQVHAHDGRRDGASGHKRGGVYCRQDDELYGSLPCQCGGMAHGRGVLMAGVSCVLMRQMIGNMQGI